MFRIDLLLIRIGSLPSVTTVDHFCGERGIKGCNVEVGKHRRCLINRETDAVRVECKLNVHKRCTRNVANDCGLDKKKLADVLADLNISTGSTKPVCSSVSSIGKYHRSYLL